MKNESCDYFSKLKFYENRIESLVCRKKTIEEKCRGKYDITEIDGKYKCMRMKGSDYLIALESEITYDIEAYIDTFFSALEHVLTLLYPFTDNFSAGKSYYSNCIRNTKWHWEKKIQDVCGSSMPDKITSALRRIKEVYRNHNTHGGFSREMMAYVQIPNFGRFPMYVGKEYLRGFVDGCLDTISYEMYCDAKKVFSGFRCTAMQKKCFRGSGTYWTRYMKSRCCLYAADCRFLSTQNATPRISIVWSRQNG